MFVFQMKVGMKSKTASKIPGVAVSCRGYTTQTTTMS